jgi:hypothetical protein
MKKLTLAVATIGLTTSLNVFASAPTGAQPFQVVVPDVKSGFDFTLTGLYLRPTADNSQLFYATTTTGGFNNHYNEPGYSPAFGLGMGYTFKNSGNDVRLNWTHLNSSDDDSTSGHVNVPVNALNGTANSTVKFKYDAVDLDFGQYLSMGTHLQTRWFAGARFAQITQDQNALYTGEERPNATATNSSKFTGIGPRFGVNSNYYLGHNFGFVAQFAGSLLVGSVESNAALNDVSASAIDNPSQSRVVPALDGKLGLDYSKMMHNGSNFTVEAGYQVSEYFNAADTVNASTEATSSSNVGFDGPYLSVKYKI